MSLFISKRTGKEVSVVNSEGQNVTISENGVEKTITASSFKRWYKAVEEAKEESTVNTVTEAEQLNEANEVTEPANEVIRNESTAEDTSKTDTESVDIPSAPAVPPTELTDEEKAAAKAKKEEEKAAAKAKKEEEKAAAKLAKEVEEKAKTEQAKQTLQSQSELEIKLISSEPLVSPSGVRHVVQKIALGPEHVIELKSQLGFIHVVKLLDKEGNLVYKSPKSSLRGLFSFIGAPAETIKELVSAISKVRKAAEAEMALTPEQAEQLEAKRQATKAKKAEENAKKEAEKAQKAKEKAAAKAKKDAEKAAAKLAKEAEEKAKKEADDAAAKLAAKETTQATKTETETDSTTGTQTDVF